MNCLEPTRCPPLAASACSDLSPTECASCPADARPPKPCGVATTAGLVSGTGTLTWAYNPAPGDPQWCSGLCLGPAERDGVDLCHRLPRAVSTPPAKPQIVLHAPPRRVAAEGIPGWQIDLHKTLQHGGLRSST